MKKKLIVIIILLVVLIAGGGFAFAYFFTDIFKSDKELFFEYISENGEILEFFQTDEELKTYGEKEQTSAYTSSGSIVMTQSSGISLSSETETEVEDYSSIIAEAEETTEETESVDASEDASTDLTEESSGPYDLSESSITFTTSTDKANNYVYKNINFNYSDEESLNVEYINNQDYYGVKINDVLTKYITIKNEDLKTFATTLGLDSDIIEQIPDKIDFEDTSTLNLFTEEELDELKSTYSTILYENLTDDMFSKSESSSGEMIYTLNITEEQFVNICIKILEEAKEDEIIFGKVKEIMVDVIDYSESEADEYIAEIKEEIQEIIDEANEYISTETGETATDSETSSTTDNNLIVINIYVENKALTKTEVVIDGSSLVITKNDNGFSFEFKETENSESYILNIAKTKTSDSVAYTLSCFEDASQMFSLNINFSGLSSLSQVNESSTFTIDVSGYDLSYTYNNTKTFVDQISQDVTSDNMLILNNASNLSTLESLFDQVATKLEAVNSEQMDNLKVVTNPMICYAPSVIQLVSIYALQESGNTISVATVSNAIVTGIAAGIQVYNSAVSAAYVTELEEAEKQTFNAQFTIYEGSNVSGSDVNILISSITASNASESAYNDTPRLIDVVYVDEETNEEIDLLEAETLTDYISADEYYTVNAQYGDDEYLNKMIITID